MFVRIARSVELELWQFSWGDKDFSYRREFQKGEVYRVGEVSDAGDSLTVIEFVGLGVAEVFDDCWEYCQDRIVWVPLGNFGSRN